MSGTKELESSSREADRVDVRLGRDASIDATAQVGYRYASNAGPTVIGHDARVRANTIIYGDVEIGDGFTTGHGVLVRENTTIGDAVLAGTGTILDGSVEIGSHVSLQSGVYVPAETEIGDHVFVGPNATFTNDPYPLRQEVDLDGPTLERGVSVGANATVLPGVTIGERSFVAAGAVVTDDVPPESVAVGVPATHRELPPELQGGNAPR